MKKNAYIFSIVRVVLIFIFSYFSVVWVYKTILVKNELKNSVFAKDYVQSLISESSNQKSLYTIENIKKKVKEYTGYECTLLYPTDFNTLDQELKKDIFENNTVRFITKNNQLEIYQPVSDVQQKSVLVVKLTKNTKDVYFGILYFKIVILVLFVFVLIVRLYTLINLYKSQQKIKQYRKQLDQNQVQFEGIANVFDDVFFIYDFQQKKYEFIGAKCKNLTGFTAEEFYSNPKIIKTILLEEEKERHSECVQKLIKDKKPYQIEYKVKIKNQIKYFREHGYPILDNKKNVVKLSGLFSDITSFVAQEKKLKKIQKNTKLLVEVGYEISQHLTVEDITKSMYSKLNKMMKADFFGIGIVVKDKIKFPYFIEKEKIFSSSYSLTSNVLPAICVNSKKGIFISNYEEVNKYTINKLDKTVGNKSESVIYLPLRKNNEVIGVITVQSKTKNAFSSTDKNFLTNISEYIVRALLNAEQYESLEEKIEERTKELKLKTEKLELAYSQEELLSKIGAELSGTLRIEEVFDTLYTNINKMLDANIFSIRLVDRERSLVNYKYNIENKVRMPSMSISLDDDDNYTVWSLKKNKVIFINDNLKEYNKYVKEIKVPFGKMPNSLMFVPLVNNNQVMGVITIQSFEYNAYSERDLHILKTLAFYTSIALSNAQLYETLELKVQERTLKLKEANKSMIDSINYTKNIQDSTLTDQKVIAKLLKDHFVFYRPKDILSGDFYRVDKVNDDLTTIIVGDCTGHGVPGASLAILCSNIIKQGIIDPNVINPSQLLTFTRNNLISYFKNSNKQIQDGMDGVVLLLNHKTLEMQFSGAYNNAYIVRDKELITLKGDKTHVGFSITIKDFTLQSFQLQKDDFVFLSTDGYSDQFGGERYKKYSRKKMLELFTKIANNTASDQLNIIESEFKNWKNTHDQIDDVCVFGFRA